MNYLKTFLPYLFGNKKGKSLEISLPKPIPWPSLSFEEVLMFHALSNSLNQYVHSLDLESLSKKDLYQLFNFIDLLHQEFGESIVSTFMDDYCLFFEAAHAPGIGKSELQELLDFKNNQLSVFAILNKNRKLPGVLVIRKPDGRFLTNDQLGIWSIPVLGLSGRGLAFHHSNGNTPAGVFSLDSVMPEANKFFEFGEFRRLIVNFIPESANEASIQKLLPVKHHQKSWWKPSVVGRVLGRSLLRIHGTGRDNFNPFSPYFPLVPTSGCLATNEAKLFGKKLAQDQRLLLDALMKALNLLPTFENESKIHGLLYVVDFDDNLAALHFLT